MRKTCLVLANTGLVASPEARCGGRLKRSQRLPLSLLAGHTVRHTRIIDTSEEDVRSFRVILRDAGSDRWLNDRHFNALKKLGRAELDAVTYASIASFFDPAC
jgi:hypothetical protein